jgi:predicted acyl esterase
MIREPRVRLEIRKGYYRQEVRHEDHWPIRSVQPMRLYLCARTSGLQPEPVESESRVQYRSTGEKQNDTASFSFRFDQTTELTGGMRLKLWVSTSVGDDLDLFVVIRKFDTTSEKSSSRDIADTSATPQRRDGSGHPIEKWTNRGARRYALGAATPKF